MSSDGSSERRSERSDTGGSKGEGGSDGKREEGETVMHHEGRRRVG